MKFSRIQQDIFQIAGFPGEYEVIGGTAEPQNLCGDTEMINFDEEEEEGVRNRQELFDLVARGYVEQEGPKNFRLTQKGFKAQKDLFGVFKDTRPPDGREE
jgi:hypothetical protein